MWESGDMARLLMASSVVGLLMVIGCASYEPEQEGRDVSLPGEEIVVEQDQLVVRLHPVFEKTAARNYFGINPAASHMMPAMLSLENVGDEIVRLDLEESYLVMRADEQWHVLALDEAIDRALRSDAEVIGWALAFGTVGAIISMDNVTTTNRTLEQDYHAKHFRPVVINGGQSGHGVVFFERPVRVGRRVGRWCFRSRV